ncbi:zinc finger (C3HC4-type RING finger) family protein, partial [Reticulomyxa filosa]
AFIRNVKEKKKKKKKNMIVTTTILSIGWNDHCKEPLKFWVLLYTCRHFVSIPLRIFMLSIHNSKQQHEAITAYFFFFFFCGCQMIQISRIVNILTFLWFLVGQSFLFTSKSCQSSAPVVWYYCLSIVVIVYIFLALPFLIVVAICICLPCVLIVLRFFAEPEGANNEVIKSLPTRVFKQLDAVKEKSKIKKQEKEKSESKTEEHEKVDEDGDDDENKPGCAICMADYGDGDVLNTLPCGHEFHKECVAKWLPIKKICPLCRYDVTKKQPSNANPSDHINNNNNRNNNRNTDNTNDNDNNNNNNNNIHVDDNHMHNNVANSLPSRTTDVSHPPVGNNARPMEEDALEQA